LPSNYPTSTATQQTGYVTPSRGVDVAVGGKEAASSRIGQQYSTSLAHEHQGEFCPKCISVSNISTALGESFSNVGNVAQVHFMDSGSVNLNPSLTTEQGQPVRIWIPPQNIDSEIPSRRVVVQVPARRVRVTIPGRYITVDNGAAVQVTNKPVIRLDENESIVGVGQGQGVGGRLTSLFYTDTHPEDYSTVSSSSSSSQPQMQQQRQQAQNTNNYNEPIAIARRTTAPAS
jgi:hypothetical protein